MLKIEDALFQKDYTYHFKCLNCPKIIKSKSYYLIKHSGLCASCVTKKAPFEHIFKRLCSTAKNENKPITLTFEEFKQFTTQKTCHYCIEKIEWNEYAYKNNKYYKGGYFLDRKNNNLGYTKENCVVCCIKCNIAKGNRYSYEQWLGMTQYFRNLVA